MTLGAVLMVVRGGRGEVKLKVGKAEVLMGSEMAGRSGNSATLSQKTCTSVIVSSISRHNAFYSQQCKPLNASSHF